MRCHAMRRHAAYPFRVHKHHAAASSACSTLVGSVASVTSGCSEGEEAEQ